MNPGPSPKHPSVRARRNDPKKDFTILPAAGRQGEVPPWPLTPDLDLIARRAVTLDRMAALESELGQVTDGRAKGRLRRQLTAAEMSVSTLTLKLERSTGAELALWAELWATPQAAEWERSHAYRSVAIFVRYSIKAELGNLNAAKEARMWSDRLGLNPLALFRLRAEVERVDAAENRGAARRQASRPRTGSDPRLLYAVDSTDGAS